MFPEWMKQVPGKDGHFLVDPDVFYPMFLKEMGVGEGDRNQFNVEVAYGCMKLDAQRYFQMAERPPGLRGLTLLVRGDEGRKLRWNHTMFPPGPVDITADAASGARNRAVREMYRRLRGA